MSFQTSRNVRRMARSYAGRFRGGKLNPVMAEVLRESESAMLTQSVTLELDPIAGRMITPIMGQMIAVYVPAQAMDALKNPGENFAGMTEVVRDKLLSGTPLFGTEAEGEISKRCGVVPKSVGGVKKVSETVRLAHNCAVNYLRQRKYTYAAQLLAANTGVTPALIGQTVLDRLNGVLDPEDRVNGKVDLQLPNMLLPVTGLYATGSPTVDAAGVALRGTNNSGAQTTPVSTAIGGTLAITSSLKMRVSGATSANTYPDVAAVLNGGAAGSVSLTDFYNAQRMDELVREMRQIVDDNPEYGEEMVLRWAHGLSVDTGKTPWVLHESEKFFAQDLRKATDKAGLVDDTMQSDMAIQMGFTVPVPATELGGVVITFAVLKPDETLASQPHPFLSDVWTAIPYVAEELARDPVPVTIRELNGDCLVGDETTVAFYTGHNELKKFYVNYGFNRHLSLATVASKTALWQLEVPMSVTPSSVIYPETLAHYPFADQNAEVCTYQVTSNITVQTPITFGPTPVEELAVIETADVFNDIP